MRASVDLSLIERHRSLDDRGRRTVDAMIDVQVTSLGDDLPEEKNLAAPSDFDAKPIFCGSVIPFPRR